MRRGIEAIAMGLATVAILGVGTTTMGAPRASLKNAYRYKDKGAQSPEGAQGFATVHCPQGEPLVGGGVASSGGFSDHMLVNGSEPIDTDSDGDVDNGWRAYVDNLAGGEPAQNIIAHAICDRRAKPDSYRYKEKQVDSPEGSLAGARAKCPRGEPLVGGGVHTSGMFADGMRISSSAPDDVNLDGDADSWTARVQNAPGGRSGQRIVAFAICDRQRSASSYRLRSTGPFLAPAGAEAGGALGCKASEAVVSGGILSSGAGDVHMSTSAPTDSDLNGSVDAWVAFADNDGAGDQTIQINTVCRR
jgi:hypothetical protein